MSYTYAGGARFEGKTALITGLVLALARQRPFKWLEKEQMSLFLT